MSTEARRYLGSVEALVEFEGGARADVELEVWAAERGWRVSSPQGRSPRALSTRLQWVPKWRALTETDRRSLDAIAEWTGGRLVVWGRVADVAPRSRAVPAADQLGLFGGGRAA